MHALLKEPYQSIYFNSNSVRRGRTKYFRSCDMKEEKEIGRSKERNDEFLFI